MIGTNIVTIVYIFQSAKRRLSAEDRSRPKTPEAAKPSLRKQSTSVSSVASAASSKKDTPPLKKSKSMSALETS